MSNATDDYLPIIGIRLSDCWRVFDNKWDTLWWLGENYHAEFGQAWPNEVMPAAPEGHHYPVVNNFFKVVAFWAVIITIVRFVFERAIAGPIGKAMGLKDSQRATSGPEHIEVLEKLVRKTKFKMPKDEDIKAAAKSLSMETREVERWVRRKLRYVVPGKLTKFKEAMWRCCFYTCAFVYGFTTLWDSDFIWNTRNAWVGHPTPSWGVKDAIYYYYVIEGSFYCSLMVCQFFDTKRKDFWEMFVHHICTLTLIFGSYTMGALKQGVLVMATHDVADIFLEAAKCMVYTKRTTACNVIFAIFAATFFVSRLIWFPLKVLWTGIFDCQVLVPNMPVHSFLVCFILVLQGLHIYWWTFIFAIVLKAIVGEEVKDNRSEDETPPSSMTDGSGGKKGQ